MDENAKIRQETERLKTENAMQEKVVKACKESVTHLKWGLWGMIVLAIGTVTILTFKSTRDYREALQDAKEAAKETKETAKDAEKAAEKAREWEGKAQKTFDEIDITVKKKFEEIEKKAVEIIANKGEETIKRITEEAEKQRQVNELFAKGTQAMVKENNYEEACRNWQEITSIEPNIAEAWFNWGAALSIQALKKEGAEADRLFAEAYTKYQKAVEIKPDMYLAWHNWGVTLSEQAKKKEGKEKQKLLQEAREKFSRAEQIKKGEGG